MSPKDGAAQAARGIRRKTLKHYPAEEKIRIVLPNGNGNTITSAGPNIATPINVGMGWSVSKAIVSTHDSVIFGLRALAFGATDAPTC
ncbi:MAG: hypothetical protein WD005_04790 [Haliea sp.]